MPDNKRKTRQTTFPDVLPPGESDKMIWTFASNGNNLSADRLPSLALPLLGSRVNQNPQKEESQMGNKLYVGLPDVRGGRRQRW
jgi:hypothetical protein